MVKILVLNIGKKVRMQAPCTVSQTIAKDVRLPVLDANSRKQRRKQAEHGRIDNKCYGNMAK